MKGLLISGGTKVSEKTLLENIEDRYIIVADGGIKNLIGTDIIPDEVLGDFDSIDDAGREFIEKNNIKIKKYPTKKDFTDTELCLEVLLEKGADDIVILAATGTRLDHMFSSMFLLERLKKENVVGRFIDDHNEVRFISNEEVEIPKNNYKYFKSNKKCNKDVKSPLTAKVKSHIISHTSRKNMHKVGDTHCIKF